MLLTRAPLTLRCVRLACVRPAASVRSEPGSNSQVFCGTSGQNPTNLIDGYYNVKHLPNHLSPNPSTIQRQRMALRATFYRMLKRHVSKRTRPASSSRSAACASLLNRFTCQRTIGQRPNDTYRPAYTGQPNPTRRREGIGSSGLSHRLTPFI